MKFEASSGYAQTSVAVVLLGVLGATSVTERGLAATSQPARSACRQYRHLRANNLDEVPYCPEVF